MFKGFSEYFLERSLRNWNKYFSKSAFSGLGLHFSLCINHRHTRTTNTYTPRRFPPPGGPSLAFRLWSRSRVWGCNYSWSRGWCWGNMPHNWWHRQRLKGNLLDAQMSPKKALSLPLLLLCCCCSVGSDGCANILQAFLWKRPIQQLRHH